MMFTYEEILERRGTAIHPYDLSFVIVNKKGEVVFYGRGEFVREWVMDNCYKDVDWYDANWRHRIYEWILDSIKKKRKYKGYHFHYYDKKWERKIKILKMLKNEPVVKV
jgi:hypothetical protein